MELVFTFTFLAFSFLINLPYFYSTLSSYFLSKNSKDESLYFEKEVYGHSFTVVSTWKGHSKSATYQILKEEDESIGPIGLLNFNLLDSSFCSWFDFHIGKQHRDLFNITIDDIFYIQDTLESGSQAYYTEFEYDSISVLWTQSKKINTWEDLKDLKITLEIKHKGYNITTNLFYTFVSEKEETLHSGIQI